MDSSKSSSTLSARVRGGRGEGEPSLRPGPHNPSSKSRTHTSPLSPTPETSLPVHWTPRQGHEGKERRHWSASRSISPRPVPGPRARDPTRLGPRGPWFLVGGKSPKPIFIPEGVGAVKTGSSSGTSRTNSALPSPRLAFFQILPSYQTPRTAAMPEPCPAQLQPSPIQTPPLPPPWVNLSQGPTLGPIAVPTPAPNIQSPGKSPHPVLPKPPAPAPTRRVSHLGPAGGVCGGVGRLGQLMLKGANCHRES